MTMWQLYFANLHACAQLKKLAVVNNAYGGGDLQQINPEVRKMPLRELDLSGNRLYREDMFPVEEERERETAFVELLGTLGECKTLQSLSLADMNLVFMLKKVRRQDHALRASSDAGAPAAEGASAQQESDDT